METIEIVYDKSFGDFCNPNGMLILDLEEFIKEELTKGNKVEFKIDESLKDA